MTKHNNLPRKKALYTISGFCERFYYVKSSGIAFPFASINKE
jgi:hypothetical protein